MYDLAERAEMFFEPEPARVLVNADVEGARHICHTVAGHEGGCPACEVMQEIEEASAFDPAEWATTPEPVGAP